MHSPLPNLCLLLWIAGVVGMLASKGGWQLGPGSVAFDSAMLLWLVGLLGYASLGFLHLATSDAARR